jgi:hypothetical protein
VADARVGHGCEELTELLVESFLLAGGRR